MRPSYWLKVDRADEHLVELQNLIAPYEAPRPYTISHAVERKSKQHVYRTWADTEPDPTIAIVVGDIAFNLRSALDHLRVALAPRKERFGPGFPAFTDDIWERDRVTGKYLKRHEERRDIWNETIRGIAPDAIAEIDKMQPFRFPQDQVPHLALTALTRINNADKHRELIPVVAHLDPRKASVDGKPFDVASPPGPNAVFGNGAVIARMDREVDVEASGGLVVAIRVSNEWTYDIRQRIESMCRYVPAIIETLEPYVRG